MIAEPGEEASDQDLLSGLRELVQQVFRDTETLQVDGIAVYQALDRLNLPSKAQILQQLQRIERDGKFSRTRLDDLINNLEEASPFDLELGDGGHREARRYKPVGGRLQTELRS